MRRPQRPHGYYCAICSFSSGGKIIQKKPNAYYDPCPRPMAWVRVKRTSYSSVAEVELNQGLLQCDYSSLAEAVFQCLKPRVGEEFYDCEDYVHLE